MTDLVARLRLVAQTEGSEGIRALSGEMKALAAQGGEAAPKFQALADELDKLSGQQALVERFAALRKEVAALDGDLGQAQTNIDGLAGELSAAGAATAGFAQAQAQSSVALEAAKQKHAALKQAVEAAAAELGALKASAREGGAGAADYAEQISAAKEKLAGLKQQSQEAGATVKTLAADHRAAAAALREAQGAEAALGKEYDGAVKNAGALSRALGTKREALDQARAGLKEAGIETGNLAAKQIELKNAIAAAGQSVATELSAAKSLAEQRRQEAAEEQRLAAIIAASKARMAQAAQDELEAEKRAFAESTAAAERYAARQREVAQQVASGLEHAFGVAGVRSAQAIEQEIRDVERALQRIAAEAKVTGPEFDRVWAAGQQRIAALKGELAGVPPHLDGIKNKGDGVIATLKGMAGAFVGIQTAQQFLQANVELEQLRRGLVAVTGSAGSADAEMGRLRDRANQLGVEVGTLGRNYISLAAATRGTVLEGQATREVFDAVTGAMGSLGRSSAETERALQAVSQMASKGTVAMEELRGQLGEALPGALDAAAKGLGLTKQELIKLVESGGLLAEDFLPALANGLKQTFGEGNKQVEGFAASWQRLKNTVAETAQYIGDTGVMQGLAVLANKTAEGVRHVAAAFELVGKQVGITAGAIATFDLSSPIQSIRNWWKALGEAEQEVKARLEGVRSASTEAAAGVAQAAQAGTQAGQQMAAAAPQINQAATAMQAAGQAGQQAAKGATAAGQATAQAGSQAQQSAVGWVAVQNAYAQVRTGAEAYTAQVTKVAEAKKAEGEAAVRSAELTGNEIKVLEARAAAAQADAAAGQKIAQARQTEVSVLQSQVAALQETAKASGSLTEAKQAELDKLNQLIAAKQTEAEKSRQSAAALQAEAEAAKQAAFGVEAAFQRLGVASSTSLQQAAASARRDFDLIASSGKATAVDLQQAFAAYAEKAIAANNGVADWGLRAEAAMHRVSIAADESGRTVVQAMGQAGAGVDGLGQKAEAAAEKFAMIGQQAEEAAGKVKEAQAGAGGDGGGGGGGGSGQGWRDGGTAESPYLALFARAEQIGGLKLRKQIEQEFKQRFEGRMDRSSFGFDILASLYDKLDQIQIAKEEGLDPATGRKIKTASSDGARYPSSGPGYPAVEPKPAPPASPANQRYEVAITLGGQRQVINTASQADAGNLVALLQQLETDMNRMH